MMEDVVERGKGGGGGGGGSGGGGRDGDSGKKLAGYIMFI